jgi:tRNA/tmRNA/rRNA uracil-C5-methylase (TrmA/RlmC/RlmD family)
MLKKIEIEIKKRKKQDKGFIFTSEDNDRKRTYLIYSLELKRRLRELAFPFGAISNQCQVEYKGENKKTGDRVLYQQEKDEEKPDKLVLISGKYSKAITDGNEELLKQQEFEKQKREEAEEKRVDGLWENEIQRRSIPTSVKVNKHYFCFKDDKGKITEEGVYIQVINQSPIQENNNSKEKFISWQVVPPKH